MHISLLQAGISAWSDLGFPEIADFAEALHRFLYKLKRYKDIQSPHDFSSERRRELDAISIDQLLATYATPFSRGASKYRGVTWHEDRKAWRAEIRLNNRRECLGTYKDEEEAARAYDSRAFALRGRYVPLPVILTTIQVLRPL